MQPQTPDGLADADDELVVVADELALDTWDTVEVPAEDEPLADSELAGACGLEPADGIVMTSPA